MNASHLHLCWAIKALPTGATVTAWATADVEGVEYRLVKRESVSAAGNHHAVFVWERES